MPPDTLTGRISFLVLQPVDALRYAHGTPAAELGGLKAAAVLLLLVNFAFALTLYHHGEALTVVPLIGTGLHLVLVYIQRVFDLFAWGMFLYPVILRRRSQGCRPGCGGLKGTCLGQQPSTLLGCSLAFGRSVPTTKGWTRFELNAVKIALFRQRLDLAKMADHLADHVIGHSHSFRVSGRASIFPWLAFMADTPKD